MLISTYKQHQTNKQIQTSSIIYNSISPVGFDNIYSLNVDKETNKKDKDFHN